MESVSDSFIESRTSLNYYLYFWGQKDWRFCKFFIFFFLVARNTIMGCSRSWERPHYIIVLFVVKHFFVIFWKKFEKVFKLEVSRKMLNRNRCRFYNEVLSLTLLFPHGKHQTPQWVYQCISMFSTEGMWAIDLYRLVCMLLLSFVW